MIIDGNPRIAPQRKNFVVREGESFSDRCLGKCDHDSRYVRLVEKVADILDGLPILTKSFTVMNPR